MSDDDRPRSASGTLMRVRAAYDQVGRSQPDYYPMLPAWDSLGIEMRDAFIAVYLQGTMDASPDRGFGR